MNGKRKPPHKSFFNFLFLQFYRESKRLELWILSLKTPRGVNH